MILKLYRTIVPLEARLKIAELRKSLHLEETRALYKDIMHYYQKRDILDIEEKEAVSFLKQVNYLEQYPYPFIYKYSAKNIKVFIDEKKGDLPYVEHKGLRVYFPRGTNLMQVAQIYNGVILEQDIESSHCYFTETFKPKKDGIFIDVGCAEGLISLNAVQDASHVYIFECEERWIEPLEATFEPWKEKVTITRKFVSDKDSESEVRLDTFMEELLQEETDLMIKIDVEGPENRILSGAEKLFARKNTMISLCTYHKEGDDEKFRAHLHKRGFTTQFSKGYMIPFTLFESNKKPPYLRRGVIRAWR